MKNAGLTDLNFECYAEPEAGINTAEEFAAELMAWSSRESRSLVILEETMEPLVELDGKKYVCKLADPQLTSMKNPIWKALKLPGFTHSVGKFLGYKWIYFYPVHP